jgi:hypothetical protein
MFSLKVKGSGKKNNYTTDKKENNTYQRKGSQEHRDQRWAPNILFT